MATDDDDGRWLYGDDRRRTCTRIAERRGLPRETRGSHERAPRAATAAPFRTDLTNLLTGEEETGGTKKNRESHTTTTSVGLSTTGDAHCEK